MRDRSADLEAAIADAATRAAAERGDRSLKAFALSSRASPCTASSSATVRPASRRWRWLPFEQALAIRQEIRDEPGIAESLFHVGLVHQVVRGDHGPRGRSSRSRTGVRGAASPAQIHLRRWPTGSASASSPLQGNVREHAAVLRRLGADAVEVRKPEQLDGLDGLVIPGGESTTFMRLMRLYGLEDAVREFAQPGLRHLRGDDRARPLAPRPRRHRRRPQRLRAPGRELRGRSRARGRPGRCAASSSARRACAMSGRTSRCSPSCDGEPVLVREGRFLVASFHPELTDDTRVHELFLQLVREETHVGA